MAFDPPKSLKVATLNVKHERYREKAWKEIWDLYEGGESFQPETFIRRRRSEPPEITEERRERGFYLGYLGEIVDLFASNLFLKELALDPKGGDKAFWETFSKNVDQRGSDLSAY